MIRPTACKPDFAPALNQPAAVPAASHAVMPAVPMLLSRNSIAPSMHLESHDNSGRKIRHNSIGKNSSSGTARTAQKLRASHPTPMTTPKNPATSRTMHAPAPTPMMAQYLALKTDAEDCLLFYRMGDFFEMFFDDAKIAAACLDIALTARGEHDGAAIPMCGVPAHSAESYLARL